MQCKVARPKCLRGRSTVYIKQNARKGKSVDTKDSGENQQPGGGKPPENPKSPRNTPSGRKRVKEEKSPPTIQGRIKSKLGTCKGKPKKGHWIWATVGPDKHRRGLKTPTVRTGERGWRKTGTQPGPRKFNGCGGLYQLGKRHWGVKDVRFP